MGVKWTSFPPAGAITGSEVVALVQGGINVQSTVAAVSAAANAVVNSFTCTAGQTNFTLTANPGSINSLFVFLDGARLTPGTDYTWTSPTTLTLTSTAVLAGQTLLVQFAAAIAVTSVSNGTVTDASLAAGSTIQLIDATYARIAAETTVPVNLGYPPGTVLRYYTGTGDATLAINTAAAVAAAAGYSQARVGAIGANFTAVGPIVINTNLTGFDFQGARISSGTVSVPTNWLTPSQSASDINQRTALNAAHAIENAIFVGPGRGTTNCGIYINDTTGSPSLVIAGLVFRNVGMLDWGTYVTFGNGAFMITFDTCNFTSSTGAPPDSVYGVISASGTNNGENLRFINCVMNNRNYGISQANGNSEIYWDGSLDYMTTAISCSAGKVVFRGHFEHSSDAANWVYLTGANSVIDFIQGSSVTITANKTVYSPFYVDSSVTTGKLTIADTLLAIGATTLGTLDLVSGTGNFIIKGLKQYQSSNHPPYGPGMNLLAYGDFESANYANDWTLTAGCTRSSSQAHAGTYSLSFPGTSVSTPQAVRKFPCKPGDVFAGRLWALYPTRTAGTLYGQWAYLDNAGTVIGSSTVVLQVVASTGSTWAFYNIGASAPAPIGAVAIQYTFNLFGVVTGTETGYLDDIQIGQAVS